jgi:hypothetical protein
LGKKIKYIKRTREERRETSKKEEQLSLREIFVVGTPKGGGGEKLHIGNPYLFLSQVFPLLDIFGPVCVTGMKVSFSNRSI